MKKIILASLSPRRKELLTNLHLNFEVIPSNVEEKFKGEEFTTELIEKIAYDKAQDIATNINYPAVVIGADTVVIINGTILGKPKDKADAANMLKMLSGNTHRVVSAIAIIDTETQKILTDYVISEVTFRSLTDSEIEKYIETGEPMDKAGSYGIQEIGSMFVKSINGCYTNIVGISTYKLAEMLKEFGIFVL